MIEGCATVVEGGSHFVTVVFIRSGVVKTVIVAAEGLVECVVIAVAVVVMVVIVIIVVVSAPTAVVKIALLKAASIAAE